MKSEPWLQEDDGMEMNEERGNRLKEEVGCGIYR
jgi:hypothetical protein